MYDEDDYLQLSGIQHFAFCRRQWALAYIEMQWQENVRTVEGKILHENAHNPGLKEKRGDLLIVRAMPVHSCEMGVSGECDVVEFHRVREGISLHGKEGEEDILQLAAQAFCLEEMLCCEIEYGYLYYGEVRRRHKVEFDNAIREKVKQIFAEMHKYYEQQYTPKVKISRKCNACSLKDICLPVLNKNKLVAEYITKRMQEEENL